MKIKSVELRNYKRFNHLVIEKIPETAKLVVLLGPNGCGKSSVFDAFNFSWPLLQWQGKYESIYHCKNINEPIETHIKLHGPGPLESRFRGLSSLSLKAFCPRTAHRNDTNLRKESDIRLDERPFPMMNENDITVSRNIRRIDDYPPEQLVLWKGITKDLNEAFGKAQNSMQSVFSMQSAFDKLILNDVTTSGPEGLLTFGKGLSNKFNYKNLSSGEMAAFDLILDMCFKRKSYDDTIFCIDEPELHISPRIQDRLLGELFSLINERSQLWIATHAIGIMRKAMELYEECPDKVVFLDFGNKDFDSFQKITPTIPNQEFWERIHRVALDDLSKLVTPSQIILCEGSKGEHGFDAECYNQIFFDTFPRTKFISAGGHKDLQYYTPVVKAISKGAEIFSLRDRDTLTEYEISEHRKQGIKVLTEGSIEHYLLSDEVLKLLCKYPPMGATPPSDGAEQLIHTRKKVLQKKARGKKARGKKGRGKKVLRTRSQRIKGAAVEIRKKIRMWGAIYPGSNKNAFMRDILAPLITPETQTYKELREIIFGSDQ